MIAQNAYGIHGSMNSVYVESLKRIAKLRCSKTLGKLYPLYFIYVCTFPSDSQCKTSGNLCDRQSFLWGKRPDSEISPLISQILVTISQPNSGYLHFGTD